ncbi:hypothetical protein GCM10009119_12670 [Algoriphagus jejuensis]|uniref:Secretion system C-terminal sorting domain-containing protein n=1 Tax=Algoriphagus jejuensis TaxID=419934 RepID=A0ABP3Y9X6_9BACT
MTITGIPSQTIGNLTITNNSNITFSVTAAIVLTLGNNAGEDLVIDSGSKLTLTSTVTRMRIRTTANTTGRINGELVLGSLGNLQANSTLNNFVVNGKITNSGGSFSSFQATELTFGPNAELHHSRNGAAIPLATWDPTATLRITGTTSTTSGGTAQNFGNVILNSPGMTVNMSFAPFSIAGDLTIENGGTGQFRQTRNAFTIGGNFNFISGNYAIGNSATRSITVNGDYTQSGGTLSMSISSLQNGTLNVLGDFSHTGGTITETSTGAGIINLNGGGPTQTVTSGGTVINSINWVVATNSVIQPASASTTFAGGGTFTLNGGATLGIRATDGLATTGAVGHVRSTGTRTFNAGANYVFNGAADQFSSAAFPTSVNSIRVENTGSSGNNTVTMQSNSTIVGGDLLVNQGNLDLSSFTLDRASAGGTFSLGAGLRLNVGGTANFPANYSSYSIPCSSIVEYDGDVDQTIAGVNYGELIIGGSGTKTFSAGTSSICGNLTFQGSSSSTGSNGFSVGGNVLINTGSNWTPGAFTYQVAGGWTRSGTFAAGGSTIEFTGTTAASIGASNFENITFSGAGAKSAIGPLTITGNVSIPANFTAGAFTHTVGGNWTKSGTFTATGSTIDFNGANPASIGASNFNHLTFSGLGAKTATGALTSTGNITVTTNFSAGSFSHSLMGNWSSLGGFTQGTSTLTFNGSVAQSVNANGNTFHNLVLNNLAGLTAASPLSITNELSLDAGVFAAGTNLTPLSNSRITRKGTGTSTGMTGTIQGANAYDVRFEGGTKTIGTETSGTGLRDVTLAMNTSTTLTAGTALSLSQLLTIPTGNTLDMSTFALTKPTLTTAGTGKLQTANTSTTPIPVGRTWSFQVDYTNATGAQRLIYGTYNGLAFTGTSGTVTFAQASEGNIVINSGQFTNTAGQTYTTTGSTLVFNASAAQTLPGISFNNVSLAGSGDKTFNTATSVTGTLSITPGPIAKLGNTNRPVGALLLNNVIQPTGTYGSTASAATNKLSAYFGTTGSGTISVTSTCINGEWLGTTSSNWFDPTNWCGGVPTNAVDVTIPATAPNQPTIGANGAISRSLQIQSGATLTISGDFTLSVEGNWTNSGTFVPGTSTVNFSGATSGFINASNFHHITFSGTGIKSLNGAISTTGNLTILASGNMDAGSFTHTLAGNFINAGAFDAETSTFLFNSGTYSISGTGAKNFYNLQVNGGAILTISSATSISNSLQLQAGTLTAGTNLSLGANALITRAGTPAAPTTFTGTLQGGNPYDVIISGESKTAGAELSGIGLRNVTFALTAGNTVTAASSISHSGVLTIPSGNTLAMSTFALANATLTTSGTGTLTTQNTGTTPLPGGKTWSFFVNYSSSTGGQKVVYGNYNGLAVSNVSGNTTLAPESDGGEIRLESGNFSAAGTFVATGSTVRFSASGAQSVPGIAFNNLILDGTGNKTFVGTSSISGTLTVITGVIARLASFNHSANLLTLGTTGQSNGTFGSTASSASFKISSAFGSSDTGILTVASGNCTPGLWLGYVSSDWNDAANWCGSIPTATTDVTISSAALNQPIIGAAGAIARSITIQTGASLGFSGAFNLDLFGNWTNNGTFSPNQGRVTFKGAGNQTLGGTSATSIYRVILEKTSADQLILNSNLTIANSLLLSSGTLTAGTRLFLSANTQITRGGTAGATTAFTGTIQGTTAYDVTYTGTSKTTGAELSGTGLRNITLNVTAGSEITAAAAITQTGQLAIPASMTFNLSTFTLNGTTTTSGAGLLKTSSTANPPIPRGRTWTFEVNYTSTTGGQRIVFGIYNSLKSLSTSGTNILDPISAGGEIEIASGDFTKSTGSITGTDSKVNFSATGNQSIPVISYADLILQGTGDKNFQAATTITGTLSIDGSAIARLGSGVTHTAANAVFGNTGQPNGSFGSTASAATYKVAQYFGTTGTGIITVSNSTCTPGIWLGYVSSNYNSGQNWCGGSVPNTTTDVVIPAGTPFSPVISSGSNFNVQSMSIESGATLEIQGARSITVAGSDWTNDGTFIAGTASTVIFSNADEDQAVSGSGANNFYNLTINKANSGISIDDAITITGKFLLADGDVSSNDNITMIANSSFDRVDGTFAGTIQGSNAYDLTYLGGNKTTTGEVSGLGLRNLTLSLSGANTVTAGSAISISGALAIPNTQVLAMGNNALSGDLTTSGTGSLTTTNNTASPLPGGRTWAFAVNYARAAGGQKVVYGVYNGLTVGNTSGTTTFAPQTEGSIEIASGNIALGAGGTRTASTARLRFSATGAQTIPALSYANLELVGSGDKTLAGAVTVTGDFLISGTAVAKLLGVNHTANTVTLGNTIQPAGTYGSTASTAQFKNSQYFGTTGTGILTAATGECVLGTWFGITDNDWNNASNWCGGVPTLTTDVIIPAGTPFSPVVGVAGGKTQSITIASGATLTMSGTSLLEVAGNWINNGTFNPGATSTLEFKGTGNTTINSGPFANVTFSGTGVKAATGSLSIAGNVLITGSFNPGAFTHTVGGSWTRTGTFSAAGSTINFNGAAAASIGTSNFGNVIFSGAGVKTATGALNIAGNVSVTNNFNLGAFTHTIGGNLTNTGTLVTAAATIEFNGTTGQQTFSGISTFNNLTINNTSGLVLPNSIGVNNLVIEKGALNANNFNLDVKGNWTNNSGVNSLIGGTGTATFSGTTTQTIGGTFSPNFNNLTVANSESVVLANNTQITGDLVVSTGTLNLSTFTANRATPGGNLTVSNNATLRIGGTNSFPTNYASTTLVVASTVEYSGTNQTVANKSYGNLILSSSAGLAIKTLPGAPFSVVGNFISTLGSGTSVELTAGGNITIDGNVSIGQSTVFNGGNASHTIAGNWVNNGTFNGNTSTLKFTGSGASVGGSGVQNFYNLTIAGASTNLAAVDFTLSGNLATTGAGSFIHATGGTVLMTGSSKTISGLGINLFNLAVTGDVSVSAFNILTLSGDLSVNGSLTTGPGQMIMSGTSKTISGTGNLNFNTLSIPGSVTTNTNFSISSSLIVNGSLSASAGTVTFTGTSTLSGTANLFNTTVNGTALQLSSNSTLGVAGVLTIASGTLDVTSSAPNTVNFNGNGNQTINPLTYSNLVLSNGSTKTAIGNITTNQNITIGSGTTFNLSSFTHSIYGNWNNNGVFNAGTGTVQFLGSSTSQISGPTTFNILTSNSSSPTTELILDSNVSAAVVNMTQGVISTGPNTLTITETRTGNGYIFGTIQRTHTFIPGTSYAFEGPENTITFSAVSGVNSVAVSVAKGTVNDFPFAGSVSRVYTIAVPTGTYTASLRLHYEDEELNGNNEGTMDLWRYNGTVWQASGKTANNATTNYVEQSGLTNITNRWTLSDDSNVVQWNGSVSSDWNTAENWTVVQGSASRPPGASDIVNLGNVAFTNQPTINSAVNVKSIIFGSAKPVTLSLGSGGSLATGDLTGNWSSDATHTINTNDQTIDISGNLALSNGISGRSIDLNIGSGAVNVGGSLLQSGDAKVIFNGTGPLTISGDFEYSGGTFTPGNGTVRYSGNRNQAVANVSYNNLTIDKSDGLATLAGATDILGNLTIESGRFDNLSTLSISGNVDIKSGAILHNFNTLLVGGNWINNGLYLGEGGVTNVKFNGPGTQTISATTFDNFEIDKPVGSQALLIDNIRINGNLTVTSGTLDLGVYTSSRTVPGGTATLSDAATIIFGANNFSSSFGSYVISNTSTVIIDGDDEAVTQVLFLPGISIGNLILRNRSVKSLQSSLIVNGDYTIESGVTFEGNSNTITLSGNWVNQGTYVPASSTVLFTGTSKNISGNTTFNKATITGSYTILNDVVFNGLLEITSSGSLSGGSSILTTLQGDLINRGVLYTLGTTTFTGNVLQTLSLINATTTVALRVNFNGSVSPVLNSTSPPEFGFLTINNTGGVNPSVGWRILSLLTVGSGASFNGGNSTHTILGSVVNNGTITSSGIINFTPPSPVTLNLGTNFSSTGTVVFGGAGLITLQGPTRTFQDVVVSNTNGAGVSTSAGWNVSNNLTINGGSTLNAGSYTFEIGRDFINTGVLQSGTSTFNMNGSVPQNIFTNSAFNNLSIDKASNSVTLLTDATVNGTLNFISGNIETNEFRLIQPSSGTVIGAGATTGWVNGNLQKNIAIGSTVKTFELGDATNFTPVSVDFESVTSSGDLVAKSISGDHPNLSGSGFRTDRSVNRYWAFTNSGVVYTNATLTLNWVEDDVDAGSITGDFKVGDFDDTTWTYPTVASPEPTSIQGTSLTSFNDVAVAELCTLSTEFSYPGTPYCSGTGTVSPTITGTSGTFTAGPGLSIDPATGEVDLEASLPGTYVVSNSASSEGGCSAVSTATISIGLVPTVTFTTAETCVGGSTGSIAVFASNGTPPYTYSLDAGAYQSSSLFTGLAAGTYTLNVKGDEGCIFTTEVTIIPFPTSTDDQDKFGIDSWIGHVYDGTNFENYIGQFTASENFDENFGGDYNCFNVVSNFLNRSIFTETFSVKFKMQSSRRGLYVVDLGSDDGIRLTVDGELTYDNWSDRGFTTNPFVLASLTGESSLLYEFYEQGGGNRVAFQNLVPVLNNELSDNTFQNFCVGNTGLEISGDTFGTLPAGISLSGDTGFQWSYSTTLGGSKTNIVGATGPTFTPLTDQAPFNQAGTFYVYRNASLTSTNNIGVAAFVATNESNPAILTITARPDATITYLGNPYRVDGGIASVSRTGTPGGIYTSTPGLSIDESTGDITLSASTVGTYTVTYTIAAAEGCDEYQATTSVTVNEACLFDFTWFGINTDWFDPINWCAGEVPLLTVNTDTIYIPSTANNPVIDGTDVLISGNIILDPDATLTVRSGTALTLNPDSDVTSAPGSLIIIEEGVNYRNLGAGVPFLQVNQLFTGDKGWRMIGAPISTNYSTLTTGFETQGFPGSTNPSLQPNLLWWDETDKGTTLQGWRQPGNLADAVPVGRGHYFYIFNGAAKPSPASGNYTDVLPLTMSTTGAEVNLTSGIFDFGVTFTARDTNLVAQTDTLIEVNQADEGFNLIANPTASMLDWDATSGWFKTNMDESIYVWDNISQSFLTWNGSVGTLGSGRIAPYQAFWVRSNAVSPTLQLSGNGAKTPTNAPFYRKSESEETSFIHLFVTGENLAAESFISFGADGESGKDPKDAYQLESLADDWLLLYSYGSLQTRTPLVINHQAPIDTTEKIIPLHLAASKAGQAISGTYLLDWTLPSDLGAGVSVILMDHITKQAINMREVTAHTFEFEAPKLPNLRTGKFQNPLELPKAVVFQSPYETGAVDPNARQLVYKPQRPFTIFISRTADDNVGYLPLVPKLFAPVPNPFSTQTKIRFYLPTAEKASIQIIDLFGQVVGEFPEKVYEEGIHDMEWIPSAIDLPSGMYFVRLMTSEYQMSQKLIKN